MQNSIIQSPQNFAGKQGQVLLFYPYCSILSILSEHLHEIMGWM